MYRSDDEVALIRRIGQMFRNGTSAYAIAIEIRKSRGWVLRHLCLDLITDDKVLKTLEPVYQSIGEQTLDQLHKYMR